MTAFNSTPFKDMVTSEELDQAKILGRALSFGAMLWTSDAELPGSLRWHRKPRVLELHLSGPTVPLFGKVAQARLQSLTEALKADAQIKIIP